MRAREADIELESLKHFDSRGTGVIGGIIEEDDSIIAPSRTLPVQLLHKCLEEDLHNFCITAVSYTHLTLPTTPYV